MKITKKMTRRPKPREIGKTIPIFLNKINGSGKILAKNKPTTTEAAIKAIFSLLVRSKKKSKKAKIANGKKR